MDGQIGAPVLQRLLQLFDKQTLAADFGQGFVENLVALGGHAQNADAALRIKRLQAVADVFGLPHRQTALAAGNHKCLGNIHGAKRGWEKGGNSNTGRFSGCLYSRLKKGFQAACCTQAA